MCGRYTLTSPDELLHEFGLGELPYSLAPRFNIAPTQEVAVVRNDEKRCLKLLRWGLVPRWAKDQTMGARLINARSETVDQKPAFRDAFKKRRCLVCADGFFEWKRNGREKTPYYMRRPSGRPLAFAGIWERWRELESFSVLTTEANGTVKPLHDRMPVVIDPKDYQRWLSPEIEAREPLEDLLVGLPDSSLEAFEVSSLVNSPANDSPACIRRGPDQQSLF